MTVIVIITIITIFSKTAVASMACRSATDTSANVAAGKDEGAAPMNVATPATAAEAATAVALWVETVPVIDSMHDIAVTFRRANTRVVE